MNWRHVCVQACLGNESIFAANWADKRNCVTISPLFVADTKKSSEDKWKCLKINLKSDLLEWCTMLALPVCNQCAVDEISVKSQFEWQARTYASISCNWLDDTCDIRRNGISRPTAVWIIIGGEMKCEIERFLSISICCIDISSVRKSYKSIDTSMERTQFRFAFKAPQITRSDKKIFLQKSVKQILFGSESTKVQNYWLSFHKRLRCVKSKAK